MGRPRTISRSDVLHAALAIADEDGLAGMTMSAVARRLSVTPMALYRHVENKTDLLDGLVELLLGEIADGMPDDVPAPPGDGWREALSAMARSVQGVAVRHPDTFMLLLTRPAATARGKQVRARFHDVLRRSGVREEQLARLERILTSAAFGLAAGQATARFADHAPDVTDDDFGALITFIEAGVRPFLVDQPRD